MSASRPTVVPFDELILDDFRAAARWHHREQRDPHEEDFVVFRRMAGSEEVFVDAGANIGNSVVSFRLFNATAPVISFEPGFWLEPALEYLHERDVAMSYHLVGLGDRAERIPLYVPCLDRRPVFYLASMVFSRFEEPRLTDTLRLMDAQSGQQFAVCEVTVTVAPLDGFQLAPTIVKIDVEDFELPALRGGASTIARHRPLIMIEGANRDTDIAAFFRDLRYRFCARAGDQLYPTEARMSASNGFYIAAERAGEYRARGILVDAPA
jgi:FkbM family methyltransferase